MPVITVVVNKSAEPTSKLRLLKEVTALFAAECHVPAGHVHVHIDDAAFFAFGGDVDTPAAYITVRSSALQILPEMRKDIVTQLMPLLNQTLGVQAERVTTFFEDLPLECIAVGSNIAVFARSPKVATGRASLGGAPGTVGAAGTAPAAVRV